jgi:hypothetical protein
VFVFLKGGIKAPPIFVPIAGTHNEKKKTFKNFK